MDNTNPKYFEDMFSTFDIALIGQSFDIIRNTGLTEDIQDLQTKERIIENIYPHLKNHIEDVVYLSIQNPERIEYLISAGFRFTSFQAATYFHTFYQYAVESNSNIVTPRFTERETINIFDEWQIHKQKSVLLNAIEDSAATPHTSNKRKM